MNAKQLLRRLKEIEQDGTFLEYLDVVTVFRPRGEQTDCDAWEEVYPDEVDGDVEHGELRLISF